MYTCRGKSELYPPTLVPLNGRVIPRRQQHLNGPVGTGVVVCNLPLKWGGGGFLLPWLCSSIGLMSRILSALGIDFVADTLEAQMPTALNPGGGLAGDWPPESVRDFRHHSEARVAIPRAQPRDSRLGHPKSICNPAVCGFRGRVHSCHSNTPRTCGSTRPRCRPIAKTAAKDRLCPAPTDA